MAEAYSGLPARDYRASRALRLLVFSLVAATLAVSAVVVAFRFVWDEFLREALDRPAYQARVELLLPAIVFIGIFIFFRLWSSAERGGVGPAQKPRAGAR